MNRRRAHKAHPEKDEADYPKIVRRQRRVIPAAIMATLGGLVCWKSLERHRVNLIAWHVQRMGVVVCDSIRPSFN